jgi:hypothetical protein
MPTPRCTISLQYNCIIRPYAQKSNNPAPYPGEPSRNIRETPDTLRESSHIGRLLVWTVVFGTIPGSPGSHTINQETAGLELDANQNPTLETGG